MVVVSQPLLLSLSNPSFALSLIIFLKCRFNHIFLSLKMSQGILLPTTYVYTDIVAKRGPHYQIQPTSFTKETILGQRGRVGMPGQVR